MMRYAMIAVAVWLVVHAETLACLNVYGTDLHGHSTMVLKGPADLADRLRRAGIDRDAWKAREMELAEGLETADFKHRSDYAVALIFLGDYQKAIEILHSIEEQHPGEYIVAANLGTAYELVGNLAESLLWIQTGFERNPESHGGSEWLHVRILETKLQLAKDPTWLQNNTVLGIDFGGDAKPSPPETEVIDVLGNSHDLDSIADAINIQLRERLRFVPPKDAIVADLLFDFGNVVALTNVVEQAVPVYELAKEYGVQNPDLLDRRIAHLRGLAMANPQSGQSEGGLPSIGVLVGIAVTLLGLLALVPVLGFVAYRRFGRK